MFDPRYEFWWLKPFVQMWGLIAELRQPASGPISAGWRLFLRIVAASLCLGSLGFGWLFYSFAFQDQDPSGQIHFTASLLSFGLFGLPTTMVPVIVMGLLAHVIGPNYHVAAHAVAMAYLLQWQLLAFGVFRKSQAPLL